MTVQRLENMRKTGEAGRETMKMMMIRMVTMTAFDTFIYAY